MDQDKEDSVILNVKTAQPTQDSQPTVPNVMLPANQTISSHTAVPAHHANKDILPKTTELVTRDQSQLLCHDLNNQSLEPPLLAVPDNTESAQLDVVTAQLTLMLLKTDYHAVDANKVWLLHSMVDAINAHMDNTLTMEEIVLSNNKWSFQLQLLVVLDKEE